MTPIKLPTSGLAPWRIVAGRTVAVMLCCALLALPVASRADDHAVILVYHHVADDTPASTSVTPDAFARHLDYLGQNGFAVLPLGEIVERLRSREPLPENAVAITFDDAYRSVYTTARPMLEIRDMPYTVFVSTAYVDQQLDNYMSWVELGSLTEHGATLGNHGVSHESALARRRGESRDAWLERFRLDVLAAQERISAETSSVPALYAWPYGEFNRDVESVIADLGWSAVAQQSGVAGYDASMTALPRFPIATGYDDMDAFALRVNAEPLPIAVSGTPERLLSKGDPPPTLTFRLDDERFRIAAVNCFNASGNRLEMAEPDDVTRSVRSPTALPDGRSKYTCTAPHRNKAGVFGWYSHLWVVQPR